MSFSNVLHLAEAAFHQKKKLEYTAKCNSFIVFGWEKALQVCDENYCLISKQTIAYFL